MEEDMSDYLDDLVTVEGLRNEARHWRGKAGEADIRAAKAEKLLWEVMQWVWNWNPDFTEDDEWTETGNAVRTFLDGWE
jgi:hypothetical protein